MGHTGIAKVGVEQESRARFLRCNKTVAIQRRDGKLC